MTTHPNADDGVLMQELGSSLWSYGSHRYARLSTVPEIIVPTVPNTARQSDEERWHDEATAETRPLIGSEQHDVNGADADTDAETLAKHSKWRLVRMVALVFVPLALLSLLLTIVTLVIIRIANASSTREILVLEIDKDILRTPCCSPTYTYVPHTDEGLSAIRSHTPLLEQPEILDAWFDHGRIPDDDEVDTSAYQRIDVLTMWVNGTDPRHHANRALYSNDVQRVNRGPAPLANTASHKAAAAADRLQNTDNRFRDWNELQYSVRSTRQRLYHHLGTHHIVSTDFWRAANTTPPSGVYDVPLTSADRVGQAPQWLDPSSPHVAFGDDRHNSPVAVRLHHDWQTFVPFHRDQSKPGNIEKWRAERLPTFSSMAAEAVAGLNVPGLAETFLLSSDDMFLTSNLTTADFYTPMFGPVLHVDYSLFFAGNIHAAPGGEGTSMEFSVALLRDRFGTPGMGYPAHIQKVLLQPLVVESRMMWRNAFDIANSHRFRGDGRVANSHMVTYGMLIERHREALLWSFIVARCDVDGDGVLDDEEMTQMLRQMGLDGPSPLNNLNTHIGVPLSKRGMNSAQFRSDVLRGVKYAEPLATTHTFSSFDGYPFTVPSLAYSAKTGLRQTDMPPRLAADGAQGSIKYEKQFGTSFCEINLRVCWPRDKQKQPLRSTHDIFTRFAFVERGCGDCLITHLVGKSGDKGLSAFLPPAELQLGRRPPSHSSLAFHLPITSHFQLANFSLASVAQDNYINDEDDGDASAFVSRRTLVLHLLQRYTYSLGTAPGGFEMLRVPHLVPYQLKRLARETREYAFLCINDDLSTGSPINMAVVRESLRRYFETIWPTNSTRWPFERR